MGLDAVASLAAATLDLRLVKSLRGAIRAADEASGKKFPVAAIGPAPNPNPKIVAERVLHPIVEREPTPTIEPRRVYHPTPRYEPRPVVHPEPRREPAEADCAPRVEAPCEPEKPIANTSPIQPPWRRLPWIEPAERGELRIAHNPRRPKIKHAVRHVDMGGKGMVIDLFI